MTALKWIVGLVILAGLGWLVWYSGWLNSFMSPAALTTTQTETATTTPATTQAQAPTDGMSSSGDTSDAAIQQDTAAVDAQMQGLSSDSANVDSSLNDQPVSQSY